MSLVLEKEKSFPFWGEGSESEPDKRQQQNT